MYHIIKNISIIISRVLLTPGYFDTIPTMKVGVYGLGRFGRFWAEILSHDFEVYGYNRSEVMTPPAEVALVTEEDLFTCDAVFLCVAISSLEEVLKRTRSFMHPGLTILDTCSVKVYPAEKMKEIVPGHVTIIGTHPMFGPDSGKNGIEGLPLVLSPIRGGADTFDIWRRYFNNKHLDVIEISPAEHDREAAYTQGVTHFIGRVLKDLDLKESRIGTRGYRALLNIVEQTCNDPLQLFMDLQHYNVYTHEMRNSLSCSISKTMKMLEDADPVRGGVPSKLDSIFHGR